MDNHSHTLVIGAGIGGLTAAALLLHAGQRVTVLESHVYPGGSAGTFYHQKYLFDAGATVAGGFSSGGPHAQVGRLLGIEWPVQPVDPAWVVHLPDGRKVTQWSDPLRWHEEWQYHFPDSGKFWRRQETLAEISWNLASRSGMGSDPLPWPPQSAADYVSLISFFHPSLLKALPYLNRSVSDMALSEAPMFRTFLDAQLLISAQTVADRTNALYGSAALDLPRRGVSHVRGGMGSLAKTLANWIGANGGQVLYRQKVKHIKVRNGRAVAVDTEKGNSFSGDNVVANLTPWALVNLLNDSATVRLRQMIGRKPATWGAFTLYLGLDADTLPQLNSSHHQVIVDSAKPLGEGNSVFISLADPEDVGRAPAGKRMATLSTHTDVASWWQLFEHDRNAYLAQRDLYTERMLAAAERAIPGIRGAVELALPGTPVTFEFFTGRSLGMVGGFPQTSLFSTLGPRTGIPNLYMVGDSIFPGQSTAGVTLGAMRVAADVLRGSTRFSIAAPRITYSLAAGK